MKVLFEGKKILVTGGSGSIGSEIVRQLLEFNPSVVRVFSNDESGQFQLQNELGERKNLRFFMGDVRDRERLSMAAQDVDIIFHAAALKHVPSCEYNPFEAVKTNIVGTQNVIDVALENNVEKVVSISTDKAVNPTSTMGATKLLSEKLVSTANYYKGKKKTVLCSVRFGNVLNSDGSVVPVFLEQIKKGGPLTVTNPKMTRYIMPVSEAVKLVFKATMLGKGGEIFILKMPALKLIDFAESMIESFSQNFGKKPREIKIKVIGERAGEKLHEELMTFEESKNALETEDMWIILPKFFDFGKYKYNVRTKAAELNAKSSQNTKLLSKDEIKKILKENICSGGK